MTHNPFLHAAAAAHQQLATLQNALKKETTMPYNYETEKPYLFTDRGQREFLKVRDHVKHLLKLAGAVRMHEAMTAPGGPGVNWQMLACVDRLVELGELREIVQTGRVAGQDRIFVGVS